ncbi:MAG: hypothetical protein AAB281_06850 [Actinomycetota bacterium]
MLLDRKRINRFTRWAAIILAIIFLLSFVLMGVGSSAAGNFLAGCASSEQSGISASSSFADKEKYYLGEIAQNPQDNVAILQLAGLYADDSVGRNTDALAYYDRYLELDPKNVDVRLRKASVQMTKLNDNQAAVSTLIEATNLAPTNAMAFLQLGQAAKAAGQNQVAILAWSRYLELAPGSEYTSLIRDEIAKLSTMPAVTLPATTAPQSQGTMQPLPVGP